MSFTAQLNTEPSLEGTVRFRGLTGWEVGLGRVERVMVGLKEGG